MENFIKKVFEDVIENMEADEAIISKYFSPAYIQYVDGHTLNYLDFVEHMKKQKNLVHSAKVTIDRCLIENERICTVHRVDLIKKNGEHIAAKVIAYFELKNGKIVLCDELTKILKGNKEDHDIGSVK
jgi:hypothetical protein